MLLSVKTGELENNLNNLWTKRVDKYGTIVAFALAILIFSILSPHFRTVENLINLGLQTSYLLVSALGLTFVAMTGNTDLSLGGVLGLCAAVFAGLLRDGASPLIAVAAGVGIGAFFGVVNGYLVAYRKLSAFIVTVAIMFLTKGIERFYSGGFSIWLRHPAVLRFANGSVGVIPNMVILSMVVFFLAYLFLHQTKKGLHIQAIGQSAETAMMAGIPVQRLKFVAFVIAGVFYALAGIMVSLRSSGTIAYAGDRLLLPTMGVCFVGQTVLGARRPNVPGVLVGALILGAISNAFTLMGIDFYYTPIAQGLVLVIAAAVSTGQKRQIQQEHIS